MNPGPTLPPQLEIDEVAIEKKKKRKARRHALSESGPAEKELNLTAMMDVLTILVVFLLKNYSTTPVATMRPGLTPPTSTTDIAMSESIAIAITKADITVDDQKVLSLDNGKVQVADRTDPNAPLLIGPLRDALDARVQHLKRIEELGGVEFKGEVLVVGDKSLDYELLSMVMYTAGQVELANFRFVTVLP